MAGRIPRQELFFYKANWTSEVDSLMLSIITRSKSTSEWDGSVIPFNLLEQVASNINTNFVFGSEPIWENLIKNDKLTTAYYYVGDPEFTCLSQLFGLSPVKTEGGNEVVLISDDTAPVGKQNVPLPQSRLQASPTMQVSESVYSPIITDDTKLRRRLFDEEGDNVEGVSTYETPQVFYVPNHEGDLVPRCAKINSKKPAKKTHLSSVSPHASS
ncbi:hypothetical protein AAHA92_25137 [Salvia divinorum]|uniref:Uncharacterized protein n=1 Tax=Salvia divinorum TaxID=28513 RepID=A0ABD1G9N8_SALDI